MMGSGSLLTSLNERRINMAKKNTIDDEIEAIEKTIASATTPKTPDPEEKVIMEIPISEAEQDDWFCCINGETFQIQRGKQVVVPRKVKEVYENEKRMKELSIQRSRELQERLMNKERNLAFR